MLIATNFEITMFSVFAVKNYGSSSIYGIIGIAYLVIFILANIYLVFTIKPHNNR